MPLTPLPTCLYFFLLLVCVTSANNNNQDFLNEVDLDSHGNHEALSRLTPEQRFHLRRLFQHQGGSQRVARAAKGDDFVARVVKKKRSAAYDDLVARVVKKDRGMDSLMARVVKSSREDLQGGKNFYGKRNRGYGSLISRVVKKPRGNNGDNFVARVVRDRLMASKRSRGGGLDSLVARVVKKSTGAEGDLVSRVARRPQDGGSSSGEKRASMDYWYLPLTDIRMKKSEAYPKRGQNSGSDPWNLWKRNNNYLRLGFSDEGHNFGFRR